MEVKLDTASRLSPLVEVKADAALGLIAGYASVYGGPPDSYGDVIAPGAFKRTIAEHKAAGTMPVLLWAHDQTCPIGKLTDLVEDRRGLLIEGQLNKSTEAGREALAHLKAGDVSGLSIGYKVASGGFKFQDRTRLLTDVDLFEVSVVSIPANARARTTSVKSFGSRSEFEEALREEWGLPRKAAKKLAAGGWSALAGDDEEEAAAAAAAVKAAEAEALAKIADVVNVSTKRYLPEPRKPERKYTLGNHSR